MGLNDLHLQLTSSLPTRPKVNGAPFVWKTSQTILRIWIGKILTHRSSRAAVTSLEEIVFRCGFLMSKPALALVAERTSINSTKIVI
jgi:hypothetical protein